MPFRCRCGLHKIPVVVVYKVTVSTYQCSVCLYILDLNLEIIEKLLDNNKCGFSISNLKILFISPQEISEKSHGNVCSMFCGMECALCSLQAKNRRYKCHVIISAVLSALKKTLRGNLDSVETLFPCLFLCVF